MCNLTLIELTTVYSMYVYSMYIKATEEYLPLTMCGFIKLKIFQLEEFKIEQPVDAQAVWHDKKQFMVCILL